MLSNIISPEEEATRRRTARALFNSLPPERQAAVLRMSRALTSMLGRAIELEKLYPAIFLAFGGDPLSYGEGITAQGHPGQWWRVGGRTSTREFVVDDLVDGVASLIEFVDTSISAVTRCDFKVEDLDDQWVSSLSPAALNSIWPPVSIRVFDGRNQVGFLEPIYVQAADLEGRHRIENEFGGLTVSGPRDIERWRKRLLACGFDEVTVSVDSPYELDEIIHTPSTLTKRLKHRLNRAGIAVKLHQAQELTAKFFGCNDWQTFVRMKDCDGALPPGQWCGYRPRFSDVLREVCEHARRMRMGPNKLTLTFFTDGRGTSGASLLYEEASISSPDTFIRLGTAAIHRIPTGYNVERALKVLDTKDPAQRLLEVFAPRRLRRANSAGRRRSRDGLHLLQWSFELRRNREKPVLEVRRDDKLVQRFALTEELRVICGAAATDGLALWGRTARSLSFEEIALKTLDGSHKKALLDLLQPYLAED